MANVDLVIGQITNEHLMILENELTFTRLVNRQYDDQFGQAGGKIGNTLNLRKPVRPVYANGQALILQDNVETSVPLVLNKQYQRSFSVTSSELKLSIDDFSERLLEPYSSNMANEIDFDGLQLFFQVFNEVGTPGTVPNTSQTYFDAGRVLDDASVPRAKRSSVLNPVMHSTIVPALQGLFNPQERISGQFIKGLLAKQTMGADQYMDQNVGVFQVGPQGGAPVVNGANQTGSNILVNAWTAAVALRLRRGDIVSFPGCFAVNPQSRQATGRLAQWVVTADVSSDGAGASTIPISGPDGNGIITSGQFQNASASPTTGQAITVQGTTNAGPSGRGLVFHENAFTFACCDLPLWKGVHQASRKMDPQTKLSSRIMWDYDINMDRAPLRMDLLGGWLCMYPQLAVRVAS